MTRGFSILYAFYDALRNIRENLPTALLSAATVGFSLSICALFVVVFSNLNSAVKLWGNRTHIVVYINDAGLKAAPAELKEEIRKIEGVKEVAYISKEKAFAVLKEELKGHEAVLEGIDKTVLPASFEIKLSAAHITPGSVAYVVERIKKFSWAEDVQYGTEWVEKFSSLLMFMETAAVAVGVFLAAAAVFIISNTIRLTVYSRRDELELMKYLGATDAFIKTPFVMEGMLQGLAGAVFSVAVLFGGRYALKFFIPPYFSFLIENPFSALKFVFALALGGLILGGAGTFVSLGRFLKV